VEVQLNTPLISALDEEKLPTLSPKFPRCPLDRWMCVVQSQCSSSGENFCPSQESNTVYIRATHELHFMPTAAWVHFRDTDFCSLPKLLCGSMYCLFCIVLCIFCFVSFYVLFVFYRSMYCLFCIVLCIICFVSFHVLFVCKCVLYFCHRVTTQLQLTNISYPIISYHCTSVPQSGKQIVCWWDIHIQNIWTLLNK
jgi:hypothetical protein